MVCQEGFILDIDIIQNHGKVLVAKSKSFNLSHTRGGYLCWIILRIGIGVADITKLKANGYYTINVRATYTRLGHCVRVSG